MRATIIGLLFLYLTATTAQEKYPQDYFRSPLDIPIVLAGTFGELRSNHFHSGIDIKTQQREGLKAYAIADGTVTRIKVSLWGYGKVIYVAHPNGYTSVYGHLQKFSPKIEAYINKKQYAKKSYEIEVFPDFGELKLEKGELLAYTGNTGGSSGPHLHFEIRSSVSEKPTNPLLYGYDVRDATDPVLSNLFVYPLGEESEANQSKLRTELKFSRQADGSYLAEKVNATGTIGFGINSFDRQDMAANQNGLYSVEQIVNGKTYTKYNLESFSFSETRYINTLIDYSYFGKYRRRIQRLFKTPRNNMSIYKKVYNDGKIDVSEGLSYNVEILMKDFKDNVTKVVIPVEGKKEVLKIKKEGEKTENYLVARKPNTYNLDGAQVYFPANTFYENFYIDLKKGKDTVMIHNSTVPAHQNFTITFDTKKYASDDLKQMFIARLDYKLRPSFRSTYKRGNSFSTRTRDLGTYTLAKDTIAPKVVAKNFKDKKWLSNYNYLSLRITDDLSGIDTYSATLNGKWILMEYEPKKNTITYNFDNLILDQKECNLEVIVTDNVGNSTTFKSTFFRK
ncbi:M23 family metallopeptidase [Cellulophaga baltica]|uniref:M23 family metallopeptidase n=1 Tax=Cellulophaga TaxID=104264 RepID=UPI001C06F3E1|nr:MULTISPECIES: M23 family metallopeptidase [Cellulophaga]MBU2996596.1 M23 family metallopeptidase [Cellulophaga baltica]MDO6767990.1 M23 family metallopeptidase [Cellulophaga sp. 1_MG-2023]